jgi:hypothetical protein
MLAARLLGACAGTGGAKAGELATGEGLGRVESGGNTVDDRNLLKTIVLSIQYLMESSFRDHNLRPGTEPPMTDSR